MEGLADGIVALLDAIQKNLYARAVKFREEHTHRVTTYDEFKSLMEGRPGFVIAAWCGGAECEADIKAETQATVRNIPFGSERAAGTCVKCGRAADGEAWFAKAY
jgi:prolyl-tRNA synthetase